MLDNLKSSDLETLEGKRSFRLCGVMAEIERRYTKKDSKPWARFNLLAKEKDFSLPMFSEAFEQYGSRLEQSKIMVVEGIASRRDGETRINVTKVWGVDETLGKFVEEITFLIDPEHPEATAFSEELFKQGEQGRGRAQLTLAYARSRDKEGVVVETDGRFRLPMSLENFRKWRSRSCVLGARLRITEPDPPPENRFAKRSAG